MKSRDEQFDTSVRASTFDVDVTSHGPTMLRQCFALFHEADRPHVAAWASVENGKLGLFWHADPKASGHPLPSKLTMDEAADLAWRWLLTAERPDDAPTGDGDALPCGWRVRSEGGGWSYCILTVEPTWAYWGK